jgi:hypothetical protein
MKFFRSFSVTLGISLAFVSTGSFATDTPELKRQPAPGPLIVPGYLAAQEFYTASHTFHDPERIQQIYGAEQFPGHPILVRAIVWRPSPNYGHAFSTVIRKIQVNLSTTSTQEDQLSATFSDNVGPDDKIVFAGASELSSRFANGPGGTKKFDMMIPLKRPFLYDPSKGNLLVDIRNFSGSSAAAFTDAYGIGGDGCSRVVSLDPNSPVADFTDTAVDPLEIIFTPAP